MRSSWQIQIGLESNRQRLSASKHSLPTPMDQSRDSMRRDVGRGMPHGLETSTLPPAMGAVRTLTCALASWITAEGLVGNLDSLRSMRDKSRTDANAS